MRRTTLYISILLAVVLSSCREYRLSDDPTLKLRFSHDSICFDTVFTTIGSSTQRIIIYNDHSNAMLIKQVAVSGQYFHINLDGENRGEYLRDIQINGHDSMYMFVRVNVDPQADNSPVLIRDSIIFALSDGSTQIVKLEAYGQNVRIIRTQRGRTDYPAGHTFSAELPYLIYDTLVAGGPLTLQKGATLYMHYGVNIIAYSDFIAQGTQDEPIRLLGDRKDRLFDSVPYAYASGMWGGVYLNHLTGDAVPRYECNYTDILSGTVGLYCYSEDETNRPSLLLANSRIHNHAAYGVVLENTDALIYNTEISNAASYCLYLCGGEHRIVHSTIASYFGYPYTNINIHSVTREDVAAVFVNNLSKQYAPTTFYLQNSIVTGARDNNLVLATPLPQYYEGEISHCYLRADSLSIPCAHENVYYQPTDTVFSNIYYLYQQYHYYDFSLTASSPARGIGDSIIALDFPNDRNGHSRLLCRPDAGCYQYVDDKE